MYTLLILLVVLAAGSITSQRPAAQDNFTAIMRYVLFGVVLFVTTTMLEGRVVVSNDRDALIVVATPFALWAMFVFGVMGGMPWVRRVMR